MKVFLSVFKNEKCTSCNKSFIITDKRRQCKQCKRLFCANCSIKIRDTKKLIGHKRYCLQCHSALTHPPESKPAKPSYPIPVPEPEAREPEKSKTKSQALEAVPSAPARIENSSKSTNLSKEEKKLSYIRGISKRLSAISKSDMGESKILREDPKTRYSLLEELYTSENITVYRVQSQTSGTYFNMKRIRPRDNDERVNIFEEVNMHLAHLHENIIKYHAVFTFESCFWIVQEQNEGTLNSLIASHAGFIPEKHMSYVCKEVLKGLDYLHSTGRIHRDINSRNVVLFGNGEVKLGDFGYAAQVADEGALTQHNPSWMAPELILGKDYNESVDLWSLGILLLEMAEGAPPYDGMDFETVMENIVSLPPPKLKNKLKWSKDIVNFLSLCLRKQAIERLSAKSLLMHPFIEDNDEQTSKDQFSEFYSGARESR